MTDTTSIALLGGTGDIGEGLAIRWAYHTDHRVIVGSRDADRAQDKADEYRAALAERDVDGTIEAAANPDAAAEAAVIVLSIPPAYVVDTVERLGDRFGDAIIVTPAVAMDRDGEGFHYDPPAEGSVTAAVAAAAPPETPVVGAFHNLPAATLADLDADLDADTAVLGDDADAKATVRRLTEAIDGLGTADAGGIANAPEVEGVTPLLINIALHDEERHHVGVRFT